MIEVRGLHYAYDSRDTLRDVSFEVREGEIFGFLGPSGAGKSTTQNVLTGLLDGYRGEVSVMGRALREWGREYYRHIGVSFELPNHYLKLSARENLELFRAIYDAPKRAIEEVMGWVGLEDHLDKRVGDYSKGMKNRLNVARSLLHRPKLWFLDEPTSGLDPAAAANLRDLIRARRDEGMTVFVTTHDMVTADELCDRVGFMVDGHIARVGVPSELRREYGSRELLVTHGEGEARFGLDGLGEDQAFLELIRSKRITSMHSQESSLAEVFMAVTGKQLH